MNFIRVNNDLLVKKKKQNLLIQIINMQWKSILREKIITDDI